MLAGDRVQIGVGLGSRVLKRDPNQGGVTLISCNDFSQLHWGHGLLGSRGCDPIQVVDMTGKKIGVKGSYI